MFKNCVVLFSVISRTMSKKCKIELTKKSSHSAELMSGACETNENLTHTSAVSKHEPFLIKQRHNLERLTSPIKSSNDKKEYAVIRLENGLTALLVSDEPLSNDIKFEGSESESSESDNELSDGESLQSTESVESQDSQAARAPMNMDEKLAACCLTVGVGSFSDPDDIPGLAHFLEHMIFMGSEKYPKENEFDSYIKKHGGSDNAATECEYTSFYFECQDKYMPKAMDIFSQLFVSPLMKREAMTREREAIDSEFTMSLPSDAFRRQQLLASTAVTGNPAGKFVWGNLKTLRDDVTDDYLYESVHKFWERHYSSHRMTLTVQARASLETLENWAVNYFSNLPCNNLPPADYQAPIIPFQKEKFNKMIFMESVGECTLLELNWLMPPVRHLYKTKPTNYLSWTIGHEGTGSLTAFLRKKLWALTLSAGHNEDGLANNSIYSLFTVSIILTEEGYKNIPDVLNAVFSYIKMLQMNGPDERIFKELQQIAEIDFRYDEESPAVENVEFLCDNMQIYPPIHYINGTELFFEYDPLEITKFLHCLSPSSVNIILSKKHHDPSINLDKVEPWFNTAYTHQDIPENWIQTWNTMKPYNEFHLPLEPNKFIATDFTLLHTGKEEPKYPEKVLNSDSLSIWYKPSTKFKLPTAYISFQIINKDIADSVLKHTMLNLYVALLNHLLVEELYPANMALLEYCVTYTKSSLLIEVYGFNEKLSVLLEKIAQYILNFSDSINEDLLNAFKETTLKAYFNKNLKIENLSKEIRLSLLTGIYHCSADNYNCLPQITIDLMKNYSKELFSKFHTQCLVQGNILKEDALEICTQFVNRLNPVGLSILERQKVDVCELPNAEKCCRIQSLNMSDSNCVTTNYYQVGIGNVKEYCIIELLLMLIEEPLFDQLRTNEQLGYDVSCSIRENSGVLGFSITVISQIEKHSVDYVEGRITSFLQQQLQDIKQMKYSEFNEVAQSLIHLKQCCDLHIKEEIRRNWTEIKYFDYAFDRLEQQTKVLSTLKPKDVIELLETRIDPSNPNYRKLTVQIVGHNKNIQDNIIMPDNKEQRLPSVLKFSFINEAQEKGSDYFITNIEEFKSKLPIFPENKIFKT